IDTVSDQYQSLENEYLRERSADVQDVGRQVIATLLGKSLSIPQLTEPGILIASDLTPAQIVQLDAAKVMGICTALGSPNSHSAILARTLGIPAVVGLGEVVLTVAHRAIIILDGESGEVFLSPDETVIQEYARRAESLHLRRVEAQSVSAIPAITHDGRHIE